MNKIKKSSTAENLIKRSINYQNIDDALDACREFVMEYEDDPHFFHMQITYSVLRTFLSNKELISGEFPEFNNPNADEQNNLRKESLASDLPCVLINSLFIDPRIKDKAKRESIIKFINLFRNLGTNELFKIFQKAEKEAKSLLVNGKIRGNVENRSNQDIYDDAKIYYKAFIELEDIEGALKGFNYLKSLNPTDPYFRLVLGAIHSEKGDNKEAIREFLYGIYLYPGEPKMTANLMNELSKLDLHFLVLDIWLHYKVYGKPELDENADQDINKIVNISKTCIMGLASLLNKDKWDENDMDSSVPSIFDELELSLRPWLMDY